MPVISVDYGYLEGEEGPPVLCAHCNPDKGIAGAQVESKGPIEAAVKFVTWCLADVGEPTVRLRSDGEPAVEALCRAAGAAARLKHGIQVLHEGSPIESSQSNGGAESAVKRIKAKVRAIARDYCSERRANDFPGGLMPWLAQHAGECITRHRRGADGRTAWERRRGRVFKTPGLPFG